MKPSGELEIAPAPPGSLAGALEPLGTNALTNKPLPGVTRERILIVEDEASVSKVLCRALEKAAFTVVGVAKSGEEAIARATDLRPDLVLMDVCIQGGMDGIKLASLLQERHAVPVIFLTGQTDKKTLQRARAANMSGYLQKPFRLKELISSVEVALTRDREAKMLREAERSLSAAVRAIGEAVVLGNREGRLCFANPVAEQCLTAAGRPILGRPLADVLQLRVAGNSFDVTTWLAEVARGDHSQALPTDTRLQLPDGREPPVEGSVAPVKDMAGNRVGVVLAFRDITRRRQSEEEATRLREELRQLAGNLQTAREEERTLIAREIHDELSQLLTGFKIDLSWLEKRLERETDAKERSQSLARVASMQEVLREMMRSARKISAQLRLPLLDDAGLPAALDWLAKEFQSRTSVLCVVDAPIEHLDLSPAMTTALFRITQESLTNVMRHANATRVQIEVWEDAGHLHLRVQDNGGGLRPAEQPVSRTFGLLGMRERALLLGGEFKITSAAGAGTTVLVRVPLQPVAKERNAA